LKLIAQKKQAISESNRRINLVITKNSQGLIKNTLFELEWILIKDKTGKTTHITN
jgi:hypothetical protein